MTTTRAPPRIVGDSFQSQIRYVRQQVHGLSGQLLAANAQWDSGTASYAETHAWFTQVASDLMMLRVLVVDQRRLGGEAGFDAVADNLNDLEDLASEVVQGLEAPDSGQARTAALAAWTAGIDGFDRILDDLESKTRETSVGGSSTSTAAESDNGDAAAFTSIPIETESDIASDGNVGWVLVVLAVGGLAYWLGRNRGQSN